MDPSFTHFLSVGRLLMSSPSTARAFFFETKGLFFITFHSLIYSPFSPCNPPLSRARAPDATLDRRLSSPLQTQDQTHVEEEAKYADTHTRNESGFVN